MSIVTGSIKFGVNYPVYVTTTPYDLPAYDYNVVISNLSTDSTINLPPVNSVPNGWTVLITNIGVIGTIVTVNANGTDSFYPSGIQALETGITHQYIANHTNNIWSVY